MGPNTCTPISLPTTRYLNTMPISSPAQEQASAIATARNAVATAGGEKEATPPLCQFLLPPVEVVPAGQDGAMTRWIAPVAGVLLVLLGGLWTLQGVGVLGGSFMTGSRLWLVIGLVVLVAGAALLLRRRRRV